MGSTLDLNGFDSSKHIWGPPGTNGGSRTDPFYETNWIKERSECLGEHAGERTRRFDGSLLWVAIHFRFLWDEANVFAVDHWEADGIKNSLPHDAAHAQRWYARAHRWMA